MERKLSESADIVGMFCRLNMNTKRELPIRTSEMGVLIFITKNNESVTPLEISNFFGISKPSVSAIIKSLVKEGYLEKRPSKTDGRSYYLYITKKGKALVNKTFNEYIKIIQLLDEKMKSEDFKEMIRLIDKANGIIHDYNNLL